MGALSEDPLEALHADPAGSAVLLDFDGTLAPIIEDPSQSRPVAGATERLAKLAESYAVVGVVSGRPVEFLASHLPPEIVLSGLYGLEVARHGRRQDEAQAGAWREAVADVVQASRARGPEGMLVEPKGLSLTLHYRARPALEEAVLAWATEQAGRSGLQLRRAKKSVELHPPVAADKGTAVDGLIGSLGAACFIGDDVGDLPAFDALDRFAGDGGHAVRVTVRSAETDGRLLARADLTVEGPAGVLDLLSTL